MSSLSGFVNAHSKVDVIGTDSQSGTSTLTLAATATAFAAGDRVLVAQMKGAIVDDSNTSSFGAILDTLGAGLFAWATVAAVEGSNVQLDRALPAGFDAAGSVQVVKVPTVSGDATVTGTIEAPPWDGEKGGVVALDIPGTLFLEADVDVSGRGFRGGDRSMSYWGTSQQDYVLPGPSVDAGQKGESITLVDASKSAGRGALVNAGGGGHSHNAGGGGGGLGGVGGQGGRTWSDYLDIGGGGGRALQVAGRAFLGGGGGGGHQNDDKGGSGGAGGGLVIVRARRIEGSSLPGGGKPTIRANGAGGGVAANDGGGGGGAGGTILLDAEALGGALRLEARGGAGSVVYGGHGPGGGGGGGDIRTTMDIVFPSGFEFEVAGGPGGGGQGAASGAAGVCPEKRLSIGARSLTVFPGYEGALVVTLRNTGVVALSVTSLSVSQIPWIALPAGAALPNALSPGEEAQVVMAVAVPANATLGAVDTSLVAIADGATYTSPLQIEVVPAPGQNLRVRVRNRQTGAPLPNAAVAIDTSSALFSTNGDGEVLLVVPEGLRSVDAVAANYLPWGTSVDCGATLATAEISLLPGEPLVTGVNATSYPNTDGTSWVYDFTVSTGIGQISLGGVPVSTGGDGNASVSFGPTNVVGGTGGTVMGQVTFFRPPDGAGEPHTWPQLWILIPGGIRVLKEFWDVIVYMRNGTFAYNLDQAKVTFDDPRPGLGLPYFNAVQQLVRDLGLIECGKQASARLIVRGDVPGHYRIHGTVSANLVLNSSGAVFPLAGSFQTEEIVVALPQFDVTFALPETVTAGQTFEFTAHITNRSALPMQGVEAFVDPEGLVSCSTDTPVDGIIRLGTIAGSPPPPATPYARDAIFTLRSHVTGRVLGIAQTLSSTPTGTMPSFFPLLDGRPVALPDAVKTYSGQPVEIPVLANDTDPEGKPLRVVAVTQGAAGSVTLDQGGKVIYTPAPWFVGTDSFTYTIADAAGQMATTTVSVDVRSNPITLTLHAPSVLGGQSVSGSASAAAPSKGPVLPVLKPISLTSSDPAAQVPASIPNPGSFTVTTATVWSPREVTITAAWGDARRSQTLLLLPASGGGGDIPGPTDPMPVN